MASEESSFENVDGRRMPAYTISSPSVIVFEYTTTAKYFYGGRILNKRLLNLTF